MVGEYGPALEENWGFEGIDHVREYMGDEWVSGTSEIVPRLAQELEGTLQLVESELRSEQPSPIPGDSHSADDELLQVIEEEITNVKSLISNQFSDLKALAYRLYAVFVHRGTVSFGHYWIYIHDIQRGIWRKYNDEYVTEVQDVSEIFQDTTDQNPPTPYFLVYINDGLKERLVDPVCRDIAPAVDLAEMEGVEPTSPAPPQQEWAQPTYAEQDHD